MKVSWPLLGISTYADHERASSSSLRSKRLPASCVRALAHDRHPVAALQRFGLVRTPAPPQVALHRISVPQSTLSVAAEYLISALGGDEMAYKIAGGTKWWQVRAGSGVEAEWIVMKKDWREYRKMAEGEQEGRSGQTSRRGSGAPEGMVGEDGGENENGQCECYVSYTQKKPDEQFGRK